MAGVVLWIVDLVDVHNFFLTAQRAGATAVAIRTTSNTFQDAIATLHDAGMKVYGWRFPPILRAKALDQAQHVVELMQMGLDGFIVDPEGHENPALNWDQPGLEDLAQDFCTIIKNAFPDRLFGITSDHRAAQVYPKLPWQSFLQHSEAAYPQAYWRMQTDHGPRPVGRGQPAPNYAVALDAWAKVGATKGQIIPMAGEIALANADEISAYIEAAVGNNIDEFHYYAVDSTVPMAIYQAIAASGRAMPAEQGARPQG